MNKVLMISLLKGGEAFVSGLLWLFGLGLLVWYPMRWWPGDSFWPVQVLNYLMPWLLLGLVPGIVVAMIAHRPALVVTLAIPTLLIGLSYAPLFLPRTNVVLADTTHLKVMSYNIWRRNPDLPAAIDLITRENPDILLLQEAHSFVAERILGEWSAKTPDRKLYLATEPLMLQAIISRYPITANEGERHLGRLQSATVETPTGPVLVWNVHTTQPSEWQQHYRQMSGLARLAKNSDMPLILGGDFNTTDQSEAYRLIATQLHNAHWEAGWGFGFSFPAHQPTVKGVPVPTAVIRIDHIFHSDHLFAYQARTLAEAGGSDHFPVVAEFSLSRSGTGALQ